MGPFEFRRLKQWQTSREGPLMRLEVPLPTTESGLVLRWCPNDECRPRRFQLGNRTHNDPPPSRAKVRRQPETPGTTCPYCGTDAEDQAFLAPEDVEATFRQVAWAARQDIAENFQGLLRRTIGHSHKFLKVRMSHRTEPRPRAWREDLLRVIECHTCSRVYGVYAIGFFCPDCGCCTLTQHFAREVALITAQVDIAEELSSSHSRELAYRLLGNAHEDVVTAFETYLKNSFQLAARSRLTPEELEGLKKELRGNPFQNLERAEKVFSCLGVNLFGHLKPHQRQRLALNFEKRHVVGHNLGIADEKFASVSESDNVGETIELLGNEIEAFARDCLAVIERLVMSLNEFQSEHV